MKIQYNNKIYVLYTRTKLYETETGSGIKILFPTSQKSGD